jgi:lactate dehydrogenase-like 2-hydroxyacid dehydrogenase
MTPADYGPVDRHRPPSRRMPHHLRLVATDHAERFYVVARTVHVEPGTPYVVAAFADHAVAAVLALSGHAAHSEREMRSGPDLSRALGAWEAGDHRLHRLEGAAARAFAGSEASTDALRRRLLHPSLLGRAAAQGAGSPVP